MSEQERIAVYVWIILGICAATMQGCGSPPKIEVSQEFRPYYDSFMREANRRGMYENTDISIATTHMDATTIGSCEKGTGTILVDKYFWEHSLDADKEELIFHELGHCYLGLNHNNNLVPGSFGRPESVMYPNHFFSSFYVTNREAYMTELFRSGQNCGDLNC